MKSPRGYPGASSATETQLRDIIEKNVDGMVVVRHDGRICFANPAAEALLGRPADQLLGTMFGIPALPGETADLDVMSPQGTLRVAQMRAVEISWQDAPAILISLRDFTERKTLEEALARRVRQLAEADESKNEFLAMLAHELRNPLAPLRSSLDALNLMPSLPPDVTRLHAVMRHQVDALVRMVDELLDVARASRGKVLLHKKPIDLAKCVHHAVDSVRALADSKKHTLALTLADEPIVLEADPIRIEQILVNLLTNAIKYTDEHGHVEVIVERANGEAVVRVRDNGLGMSPDLVEKVFDPFTQAERSLDRSQGGLGLGLSLVRSLVEIHEGTVSAASPGPGQGSEFEVRLPCSELTVPSSSTPLENDGVAAPVTARRVLVVDDNIDAARCLALILRLRGHEVHLAFRGGRAIELARAKKPQVIFLDIGLPDLDGYEVARRLRMRSEGSQTLLVAITGYGSEEDRRKSFDAGFDEHLIKPVDIDKLDALLAGRIPADES